MKKKCPKCDYQWSDDISSNMFNLKKVRDNAIIIYFYFSRLVRWISSGSTEIRRVSSGSSSSCHSWRLNKRNTEEP